MFTMKKEIIIDGKTYYVHSNGEVYGYDRWKNLRRVKGNIHRDYLRITFNKNTSKYIHTLVAQAFVPNPENKPYVNHIDGNKQNNHYTNLEWVTHLENIRHAIETGLIKNRSHISTDDVHLVCKLLEGGLSTKAVSIQTGINQSSVANIRQGNFRRDIWSKYNIKRTYYKKLDDSIVEEICKLLEDGYTIRETSYITEVAERTVSGIKNETSNKWIHITHRYEL